ncbi:unnamed protein product, partial [Cyprideis torosa]
MVGPGTGLAPFRGFIQERRWARQEGKEVGPTVLFYGCRRRNEDYLYEEEIEDFVQTGDLEIFVAFSREQTMKVYVQHLIEQQGKYVWDLLERGAHFYVCGSSGVTKNNTEKNGLKEEHSYNTPP